MKLYFRKRVLIGFLVAFGTIATLGVYSYLSTQRLIDTAQLLSRASRVVNNAEQLLVITIDLETGQRGYVLTSDENFLAPYDSALKNMDKHLDELLNSTQGFTLQRRRVDSLRVMVKRRAVEAKRVIETRKQSFNAAQALIFSGEGKKQTDAIRSLIRELQEEERKTFRAQNTITGKSLVQFQFSFVGLLVVPALIIIYLFYSINKHFNARHQAEKQLIKASGEIVHLNKELEAYTYSVSHDLRAPLRSIAGYSQILKEDYAEKLDPEGNRVIHVIVNNARRMGQLIDDLLDFSRTSRKEIIKADLKVDEMVRSIIGELMESAKDRKVDISVLPLEPVYADVNMLRQVWINLISNALKYTGKRETPKIEIGSYIENNEAYYYIRDNGVGFNMEYKDKLFGVFQRLHKADEFEGTGVGLALVKRIITRHGGKIWADATLGEGATFYFSLPK